MKKSYPIAILALVFLVVISSINVLAADFTANAIGTPSGDPNTGIQIIVNITNLKIATATKTFSIVPSILTGPGATSLNAPNAVVSNPIAVDSSATTSIAYTLPVALTGTYSGTITVSDTQNTAGDTLTIPYTISINPVSRLSATINNGRSVTLFIQSDAKSSDNSFSSPTFTITNTGSTVLNNIKVNALNITTNDLTQIAISGTLNTNTLSPGDSTTGQLNIFVPSGTSTNAMTNLVTLSANSIAANILTIPINLRLGPALCINGPIGPISVDITSPSSGDSFQIGDTVTVNADVDNQDTKSHDYIMKAVLFDTTKNKKIDTQTSDSVSISDGSTETLSVDFVIPSDQNIDGGDSFTVYVKAYRDGNEALACDEQNTDINIDVPTHKVVLNNIQVNPQTVTCGDTVAVSADINNAGSNKEDRVRMRVTEPTMNINQLSNIFTLDKLGRSASSTTQTVTFVVPTTARTQEYTIEVAAEPGTSSAVSDFAKLDVTCGGSSTTGQNSILSLPTYTLSVSQGSILDIPVTIHNTANVQKTYTVQSQAVGSFGTSDSQQVTVAPNGDSTATLTMNVDSTATTGSRTVSITVKDGSTVVDSGVIPVTVQGQGTAISGTSGTGNAIGNLFGNSKNSSVFFVIADVLLVLIALYVLVLIFRRPRKE